jgi:hypothetical protein
LGSATAWGGDYREGIMVNWRERPDVTMAGFGLLSGMVSAGWSTSGVSNLDWLQPVSAPFALPPELLPIGLCFGAAVAAGIWMRTGNWWCVPVLLIATTYAWSAAIQVAIRTQRNTGDDPHLVAASLAAGAVGAGLTHAACALFARELRRPARVGVTCVVGAVAGMLFYLGQRGFIAESWLYVGWQPAVAFAIGMGLAGRGKDG